MAKKDLFDEIIECISLEGERTPLLSLDSGVRARLFAPLRGGAATKNGAPAPKGTVPSPPPTMKSSPSPGPSVQRRESGAAPGNPASKLSQVKEGVNTYQPSGTVPSGDLGQLQNTVSACKKCKLHSGRTNTVFGSGPSAARLMFVGEGPGEDEDLQGLPFVGRAGQLLTKMISAMQFDRAEVYIANIVKCRPPGNRAPEDDEVEACLPYLERQIELIRPEVIVTLGAVPLKALFNLTGITRLRGGWLEYKGIRTMPTFHPSYLLRSPGMKKYAWEDLQKVMKCFGKLPQKP